VRINPSDTGNIRIQSLWHLDDNLRLTFDAVLAVHAGERRRFHGHRRTPRQLPDMRALGNSTPVAGTSTATATRSTSLRFYTPNTTNTKRWGANASLIWDINERPARALRLHLGSARASPDAQWGYIDDDGVRERVRGREGERVYAADGDIIRGRDRFSIAELTQFAPSGAASSR
jgi:iron complex outermembrane receptor protein